MSCRLLNLCMSGLVYVECTEALYNDNPEIQNSAEIGDLAGLERTQYLQYVR